MNRLRLEMLPQPNDTTCGPTCLHAVYNYYGDKAALDSIVSEVGQLEQGGTLAVILGSHALRHGYDVKLYSYDLQVFDPTWFREDRDINLEERLRAQMEAKSSTRLRAATLAYIDFIRLGGKLRMEVLTIELIRRYLKKQIPILTGLSATFLYGEMREYCPENPPPGKTTLADDVRGLPAGHFVVLCGYDPERRTVLVADPLEANPFAKDRLYAVDIDRVFSAIMLGIVTYDANLLIIRPKNHKGVVGNARTDRDR
ncbi:cysteine peptidase family C39 domain-containing protein [Planctomicrobium sp. SH668]|uniref:cysteine peptidase family C39 domain-containing protein n=1 Tax=Planctomicrobium sp. SH668 TaxID=3448126 RepID=UPI003F5C5555